ELAAADAVHLATAESRDLPRLRFLALDEELRAGFTIDPSLEARGATCRKARRAGGQVEHGEFAVADAVARQPLLGLRPVFRQAPGDQPTDLACRREPRRGVAKKLLVSLAVVVLRLSRVGAEDAVNIDAPPCQPPAVQS